MAKIQSINVENKKMAVTLKLSVDEYDELKSGSKYVSLLPVRDGRLEDALTIGKLGHSYRIMLPKKFLSKFSIPEDTLPKSAPAGVFKIGHEKYLVIQLKEKTVGHSTFGDKK